MMRVADPSPVLEPRRECLHLTRTRANGKRVICGAHVRATTNPSIVRCRACGRYSHLRDTLEVD